MRVPVTLLQTNACTPLATNAIAGNIWDNFSSASYKDLPSVGAITVYNPFTGAPQQYQMPAGGRGYTRVPSLISLWSTAPFLLNNSVGTFNPSPSVEARMASFNDSITKMLWPEKREKDAVLGDKIPGVIDRTTVTSWLRVPTGYLPDVLKDTQDVLQLIAPKLFDQGGLEIGPIPAGTPVDLLANFDPLPPTSSLRERLAHDKAVVKAVAQLVHDLKALPRGRHRRAGAPGIFECRRAALRAEQVPGLRRQPRPLLRLRPWRRRQEGADRVPEDVLTICAVGRPMDTVQSK